jgi:carbamoyl-phosphate synthase large subunit
MLARELKVIGLMNTQFAIQGEDIYILEVNPRASRTVPFVAKATGVALAKIAARCMLGKTLAEMGMTAEVIPDYYSVKEPIFPFVKFQGVDPQLGPEMRSTGEVMGVGRSFGAAFAKAQLAAGNKTPPVGCAFLSVRDADKARLLPLGRQLIERGYTLVATSGTAAALNAAGVACQRVNKVAEGRPHVVDLIKSDEISFIINTTEGRQAIADSFSIRREALQHRVVYSTTLTGARAILGTLDHQQEQPVYSLEELHGEIASQDLRRTLPVDH